MPTRDDQIIVTSGAQQALAIAAIAFVDRRGVVAVEDPTYPGADGAFRLAGARVVAVDVADDGLDLDQLARLLSAGGVSAVYTTPTGQNPTGAVAGRSWREELARLAERFQIALIEDETLAELVYDGTRPPPVASLLSGGSSLIAGSLSKLVWGGLRVGWLRAPQTRVAQLAHTKAALDLGTSLVSQVVAAQLVERFDSIRKQRIAEIGQRLQVLQSCLAAELPTWRSREPEGGLSLWAKLPAGSATDYARFAADEGVQIVPGPVMSIRGGFGDHLRLPLGVDIEVLREAARRLAKAWHRYTEEGLVEPDRLGVVV